MARWENYWSAEQKAAAKRIAKMLHKAADIAAMHDLLLDNGMFLESCLATLAGELERAGDVHSQNRHKGD
jgi:hypothetical protein